MSTPLLPSTITQRYRRLARRLGLRSTRIHALRHYSATELLSAGLDLPTVAGRLGHSSGGATTLRFYAAWVDEADRRAADVIAELMPRPDPTRRTPRNPYEKLVAELRVAIERGDLIWRAVCQVGTVKRCPRPSPWTPLRLAGWRGGDVRVGVDASSV